MRACRKRNQGVQPPCYMSHSCWVTLKTWGKKKHPGLSWAGLQHSGSVLLKKSPRLLKYLQAQFLSPWKFHCCVVWYVIQQNKIFPVNVLNMCSANQLVQRPAASTDETACIPSCSCFTLPSNEPLEIAVPSFAAFMKDRERKAEGTESFWGAEAASPVLCACSCVQNRERWFCCRGVKVLLAWSRGDQKGEFSLRVLVHQFAIQKTVLPSLKSWSLRREIRDGPSLDTGRQTAVVGVGHRIGRQGLSPTLICGWLGLCQSQNWNREGGSRGLGLGELKVQLSLADFHIFYIICWGRPARLRKLKSSPLRPGITAVTQKVPKGSSWQGDNISDFKHKTFIWIVVDWLKQMMILHVLAAWFLLLCEWVCDTAAGVQQVSSRSLVAL